MRCAHLSVAIALLPLLACAAFAQRPATKKAADHAAHEHHAASPVTRAICVLSPTEGNRERGVVHFMAREGEVHLQGKVTGLSPGLHGFHIHEFGDLSAPDGTSLGGHFNPTGAPHAGPHDEKRHLGDLGNIEANDEGVAEINIRAKGLKLADILGRSLVVHAGPDDLKSQPSGDSGARVSVGVIGIANEKAPTASGQPVSR